MINTEKLDKLAKLGTKLVRSKVPGLVIGLTTDRETVKLDAYGVEDIETKVGLKKDALFSYYSCTKAITAMGLLVLVQQGKVGFDDEVRKYVPSIDDIWIVEKGTVDDKGQFLKPPRKPKTNITIRQLLTNVAGFSYSFLNKEYNLLARRNKNISAGNPSKDLFKVDKMPLIAEPGSRFTYGHAIDWVGLVIESISGQKLSEFLKIHIFDKIGMSSCTFHLSPQQKLIRLYLRTRKGLIDFEKGRLHPDPNIDMGGQGCVGNVEDYLKLIRCWLNLGYSPDTNVQVVKSELVEYALKNHLPPGMTIRLDMPGIPDPPDGFSLAGMAVTGEDLVTGRPKGTLYWSGVANLYYWIDFTNKLGGFWATQVLPMADPYSLLGYFKFESIIYGEDEDEEEEDDEEDDEEEEESSSKL